ncbi:hypothetical protein G7Y89_g10218 [Cudoniella acicularis]|uniref:Protein kinase domain-containing protein n=1 Tax=Cudoniella acicularis TaxID=354080 RepID=A0A8H4W159_9HELO|nr:hypothetical protein G7Y89_g10218 [Cudoniella acicularis]
MATASPTPMGSSHFASLNRRPSSRQAYRQPLSRSLSNRGDPPPSESRARTYSLNDSSDDDIPPPMRFSALTNALLNDSAPTVNKSPATTARTTPEPDVQNQFEFKAGGVSKGQEKTSPPGSKVHSPYPRRVVRLSGTPGSSTLRRAGSLSSAVQRRNEQLAAKAENQTDLSTPAQVPRTVRIPITASGNQEQYGSSGKASSGSNSASRNENGDNEPQEYPSTVARSQLATSQGSVSKYGSSTIGRSKYGEEAGLQSSMRMKRVSKVTGTFLRGPARRGRRRMDDEEQSPMDEQGDGLDGAGSSQEPQSQESQEPESQQSQQPESRHEPEPNRASLYSSAYRDFASGSPVSSKDIINSVLRSRSPPPPTLASSQRSVGEGSNSRAPLQPVQPVFKVPAPRPDLPSTHDQENEAPPTFKKNKQAPLINFDKMEKVPTRPESMDIMALRAVSPERRPLAPRNQNTPRRPAPPPPRMSILDAATSTAGAATTSNAGRKRNGLKVNGKPYTRLDCIGRGGSSRVYRVMAENSRFFALKRVSLEDADENAVRGFKGEIDLLKKLENVERVIQLYDYELNEGKGTLSVLMEMGDLDMKKILDMRLDGENSKFDPSFVRHYWKEMLECLQAIHEHDIVHSDLKPANFVLVKGQLKLIDFGIANAIQTDETVNVHRETQIGTPNYMSPESLLDSNAKPDSRGRIPNEPKLMKLGKPSDIWSLGCILYQMVYGRAPFAHIQNTMQRCQAIINFNYAIEYPSVGVGGVPVPASLIKTLKKCLNRDQNQRPSATELLAVGDPLLNPIEYDEHALPITEELLGRILLNTAAKIKDRTPTEAELLTLWPQGYFERLRKNMAEGKAFDYEVPPNARRHFAEPFIFLEVTQKYSPGLIFPDDHLSTRTVREVFRRLEGTRLDAYKGGDVYIIRDTKRLFIDTTLDGKTILLSCVLERCRNENEIAAALAHSIALHIIHKYSEDANRTVPFGYLYFEFCWALLLSMLNEEVSLTLGLMQQAGYNPRAYGSFLEQEVKRIEMLAQSMAGEQDSGDKASLQYKKIRATQIKNAQKNGKNTIPQPDWQREKERDEIRKRLKELREGEVALRKE